MILILLIDSNDDYRLINFDFCRSSLSEVISGLLAISSDFDIGLLLAIFWWWIFQLAAEMF